MSASATPKKSLSQQLLIAITSLVVTLLFTVTALITTYQSNYLSSNVQSHIELLKQQLTEKGLLLSRQASVTIHENLSPLSITQLQKQLSELVAENDDLDFAILMSRKRTAYAHTLRPDLQTRVLDDNKARQMASFDSPQSLEYRSDQGAYLEVVTPVTLHNRHWGVLRLGFSLASIEILEQQSLRQINNTIYWIICIALLLAAFFIIAGWLVCRHIAARLTKPLHKLVLEADNIIAGDYQPLSEIAESLAHNTSSEMVELGKTLQQVSESFSQSQQAVKEYTRKLETKVQERTSELEHLRQQVDMTQTLKSEFLANMSHEIRTPLSAVMGLTHLLNNTDLSPRQQDYTQKLESSAENLLNIINDILDFAKIEAGMLRLEKRPFTFDELLDEVIKSVAPPAQNKGLELILNVRDSLPDILIGDVGRLKQVLLNLLNNALKYTECGEIVISIEVVEHADKQLQLRFSIGDTGIGMTNEQVAHLFKSFTQTDPTISRRNTGTGLGLSITKKLVEMMNGTISATSTYGIGSEFTFSARFDVPEQRQLTEPSQALLPVLLIDNNNQSGNAMERMLKRLGCVVTHTTSSPQGLDDIIHACETGQPYQLVICKADMPQLRGEQLAEQIKNNSSLDTPPKILLLSRYSDISEYSALIGNRIDALLATPVTQTSLQQIIRRLLIASDQSGLARPSAKPARFKGCHILLAEDDVIIQQVVTELLRSRDIEVTIANNGREVLDLLERKSANHIDGILMDIQMPELDGYETTTKLRSDPRYTNLPIIGLTAHTSDEEKQLCLEKGMQTHLSKPIAPEQLFDAIARYMAPLPKPRIAHGATANDLAPPADITKIDAIDLKEALQRVGDNREIYIRIAKQFINSNVDAADNIRHQLLLKQPDSALALTHSLQGASATIGATKLAHSAYSLEQSIRENQPDDTIMQQLETFESAHQTTMDSLWAAIEELEKQCSAPETKPSQMRSLLAQDERARLLLVDDNITNIDVLMQQLTIIGYDSVACRDGNEAWNKWQTGDYHMILTDINMPGMDGYELTRRIREAETGNGHTPIIAFTASSSKSDANRCIKIGMDEFLIKPMPLQDLKQTLDKWLPRKLSSAATHSAEQIDTSQQHIITSSGDSPVDIVLLIQVVGDDVNVHRKLFESYIKNAATTISTINNAVENCAIDTVASQAHKLKSASRNLGVLKLADLCEAMESSARAGQQQKLVSLLPTLNRFFDEAQTFVADYIRATRSA